MDIAETTPRLFTHESYFNRFYEIKGLQYSGNYAFEKLEREFHKIYGVNRYTSYGSFRVAKCRWWRKKKHFVN